MNKSFRMRLTKWFLAVITAAVLLSGCSQKENAVQPADPAGADEQSKTITLAIQSNVETKPMESLINQFNAAHPGYTVQLLKLPLDRYDEILNMRMTSGEGPDVFQLDTGWLATYIFKNWLVDLSTVVDSQFLNAFPKWVVDYTRENSHFYAIPSEIMTLRLIYNKELLKSAGLNPDSPPTTLQQLRSDANQISKVGTGYRRYGFALPAGDDGAFRKALEMAGTYSGVYHYDFSKGSYDFTVYESWFQTMLAMKEEGGLFPGETSLQSDTALTQFSEGNIGMMFVTDRDFALLSGMRTMDFPLGIAMPPLLSASDKGKGALMVSPESPFVINAYTEHEKEAADLWKLLHSSKFMGAQYKQGYTIPVLKDIIDDPGYQPTLDNFDLFLPGREESPYPKEPKFILQNETTPFSPKNLGDGLRMKAYRDILQGIGPPEEILEELSRQYNHSLDDAVSKNLISFNEYVNPKFDPRQPLGETQ
ncbi:ABC transporter substrate-binding protein [Paenibacillus sepulcri]|uniref:Extracellular solute-binding protein n=1 Tax=Paenibacillus sepulcri TaxID=359917 RepID=A0ABS7C490_9BACL|nr:extracellular solute-binding protein [Paenibacillus sepulcri]